MEAQLLRASSSSAILGAHGASRFNHSLVSIKRSNTFTCFISGSANRGSLSVQATATSNGSVASKNRVDGTDNLTLEGIRHSLIRQEDSIIFSLLERSQYCHNASTYNPNGFPMDGFQGSLVEYILQETEKLHARTLSKRIHYGKFVAECKFRSAPESYEAAIKEQDRDKLMALLTYPTVEEAIIRRVEMKAKTYGQEVTVYKVKEDQPALQVYKIKPTLVADLYGEWIMHLTNQVQVEYLLRRLD